MKEEEEFKNIGSSSKCVRLLCSSDDILNHILSEVQDLKTCMSSRLTSLELKMSVLVQTCNKITSRLDSMEKMEMKSNGEETAGNNMDPSIALKSDDAQNKEDKISNKLKIVPLSSESDYPNGSWLGNPKSITNRVRCNISPQNLFHVNSTCFTPEKMALCLLDNLFPREELAVSNISGRSRWGKKRLNPLLIFGIKVHLKYKFFITDKDWHKICQNIDAKCRFAWKRSQRMNNGTLPKAKLKVTNRQPQIKDNNSLDRLSTSEDMNFDFENLNHSNMDFNSCVKVITQSPCELRILNATPAQIAQLQESQEIILAEEMLPDSDDVKPIMINNPSEVSMNTVVMDGVVEGLGSELRIQDDSNHSLEEESMDAKGRTPHHQETLSMHDSQLEEGLQLEVELEHQSQDADE